MANIGNVVRGLQILAEYEPQANVEAHHDELFSGGPTVATLKPEHAKELAKLRWRWTNEYACWAIFT